MFSIIDHIEYLMMHHDCVVVPGWGALIAQYTPAAFGQDHTIERPRRTIGFNDAITHNDGLLAQSIVRREGITYDAAVRAIGDQVAQFRLYMSQGSEIAFGRLGYFKPLSQGRTQWTPFDNAMAADEFYGLHTLHLKPLEAEETPNVAAAAVDASWAQPRRTTAFSRISQIAASIVVLIGMTLVLTTPLTVNRSKHQQAGMNLPEITMAADQQDGDQATAQPLLGVTLPQQARQADNDLRQSKLQQIKQHRAVPHAMELIGNLSGKYYLVVGVHANDDLAAQFIAEQPVYKDRMQVMHRNGYSYVYIARSDDYSLLAAARTQLPTLPSWVSD